MARALSDDLRRRVVAAVVEDGMSRRGAAKQFGVAPSTAIKWVDAFLRTGSWQPGRQGGDRRSQRIEAHAAALLALIEETPDMTLAEITAHLEDARGLRARGLARRIEDHAAQPGLDPAGLRRRDEGAAARQGPSRLPPGWSSARPPPRHRCARPSRAPVPSSASCRPTRPTSTPSRWRSPSSRPASSAAPPAPSPSSGTPSPRP